MSEPLKGITVIDQTQALAGPYCTMMLGDLGANVIKIERPGIGDQSRTWGPPFLNEESTYFLSTNRNKRSITLNIAAPEAREVVYRLVDRADVFITNLQKTESLRKFGIDYETLQGRNGRLVYAALSGYGQTGPRAGEPNYDLIAQAESGLMRLTGDPEGGPTRFPTPMADMTTGLFTLVGILSALHVRNETGKGQLVDTSVFESQMTWLENYAGEYFATGEEPPKRGNTHPQVVPYEPVQGSDGEWFILGVGSDRLWTVFCEMVGLDDLRNDPRFYTNSERVVNHEILIDILRPVMKQYTAQGWVDRLKGAGIPSALISSVGAAMTDSQTIARNFIVELDHPTAGVVKSLATPVHLSQTNISYRLPPPRLGEHTEAVLSELGYTPSEIEDKRQRGII